MTTDVNDIITPEDREILARSYEESGYNAGPYPSYAELARNGQGAFTLCSLRAVARARVSTAQAERVAFAEQIKIQIERTDVRPSEMLFGLAMWLKRRVTHTENGR